MTPLHRDQGDQGDQGDPHVNAQNADLAVKTDSSCTVALPRTVPRALGPMGAHGEPIGDPWVSMGRPWGAHGNPWGAHGDSNFMFFEEFGSP